MKTLNSEKNRILKTKEYSIFNIGKNSKIYKSYLDKIIFAIQDKNLSKDFPILVDENYNILDGKYRFEACKSIGLEVYYKVSEVSNYLDALKARSLSNKPTLNEFAKYHADKLFYRKLSEVNKMLPYSFKEVLSILFDTYCNKKDLRIKEYNNFVNGKCEYTQELDFKIKTTLDFIDYIYMNYDIVEKDLYQIWLFIDNNGYDLNQCKIKYKNIRFLDKIITVYKSGNPYALTPLCFDFNFVPEQYPNLSNFNKEEIEDWIKYAEWQWKNSGERDIDYFKYLTALKLLKE